MVGLHRLEGYLLASSIHPDGRKYLSFVALKRVFNPNLFVSVSLQLRMFFHGSWLRSQSFSSPGYSHVQIPDDWFIQAPSHSLVLQALETVVHLCQDLGCRHHLGKVQSPSIAASGLSGCYPGFHSLQGFSLPAESEKLCLIAEAFLFCSTQPVSLWRQASVWPKSTLISTSSQMLRMWGRVLTWTQPLLAFGLRREHLSSMQGSFLRWSTVYGTSIFW